VAPKVIAPLPKHQHVLTLVSEGCRKAGTASGGIGVDETMNGRVVFKSKFIMPGRVSFALM